MRKIREQSKKTNNEESLEQTEKPVTSYTGRGIDDDDTVKVSEQMQLPFFLNSLNNFIPSDARKKTTHFVFRSPFSPLLASL